MLFHLSEQVNVFSLIMKETKLYACYNCSVLLLSNLLHLIYKFIMYRGGNLQSYTYAVGYDLELSKTSFHDKLY